MYQVPEQRVLFDSGSLQGILFIVLAEISLFEYLDPWYLDPREKIQDVRVFKNQGHLKL